MTNISPSCVVMKTTLTKRKHLIVTFDLDINPSFLVRKL